MEVKNTTAIYFPNKPETKVEKPEQLPAQPPLEEQAERIPKEKLIEKVREMNEFLEHKSTSLKFQLHEKLDIYYVQIIDTVTDEVLKEIPNKKFLDMYASIAEIAGLLVDEKM
ncbi:flagellar protein FlaG [Planococcus chinensis]|uniref:Flagellar protein FlaG n=1 Tax=Planococcus chinensis TaxID=272917 RepID=A0ABW4QEM2_9BACL